MHGSIPNLGKQANVRAVSKTVHIGGTDDQTGKDLEGAWFSDAMRALGINAEMLSVLTDAELRTCYRYISNERKPPGWLVVKLICSEAGPQFLALLAANAEWWLEHQRALKIGRAAIAADEG